MNVARCSTRRCLASAKGKSGGAKAQPGVATHEGQSPSSREDLAHGNSARASIENLLQKSKSQAEVAQQRCEKFGDRQGPKKSETRSRVRVNGGLGHGDATPSNRGAPLRREAECGGRRRPSFRIVTGSSEG